MNLHELQKTGTGSANRTPYGPSHPIPIRRVGNGHPNSFFRQGKISSLNFSNTSPTWGLLSLGGMHWILVVASDA